MSPGLIALLVAGIGLAAVLGNAARHSIPFAKFGGYAVLAFVGGFITTALAYRFIPVLWLVIGTGPAIGAWWLSEHLGARNYHRTRLQHLLVARLKDVIPDWPGRSILMQWDRGSEASDVVEVNIGLPPKVLPDKVTPNIRTVLASTLGRQWSIATKRTLLTCKPIVVVKDPAPIEALKKVLSDRECFGGGGSKQKVLSDGESVGEGGFKLLDGWALTPDGTAVETFKVAYKNGSAFAKTKEKCKGVERVLRKRIPVPSGSWMFEWDLVAAQLNAVRSAFQPIKFTPKIERFVTTSHQAINLYPKAAFELGIYGDGAPVLWSPVSEGTPHCNTCGSSGKGKTSWAHTLVCQAAALGWCVIIIDFKFSKSFRGFLDWPNVHLVTNGIYSNLKAIYYVVEILSRRRDTGGASSIISDDVPILVVIDEYAEFASQMTKTVWPRFKQEGDPSIPPVLAEVEGLLLMAREFRIHIVTMLQKPSANNISTDIIFNSGKKFQVGNMDGAMSNVYWKDYDIGSSFPDLPGRGLVKDAESDIPAREFQAYYTPDPIKARKDSDLATLADLLPPVSIYPRVAFDMPNPYETTQWDQIITAPVELLDERPDLDPLSPHYIPQPIFTYDTLGRVNPATMTVQ
jgi:hypothetical protein